MILAGCDTAPTARPSCTNNSTDPACVQEQNAKKAQLAEQEAQAAAESKARFDALQAQLNEETRDAETSIAAAVDATKTLPKVQRARNGAVLTTTASVTDSKTPRVAEMTMLDTVSIDMPVAGKNKRPYINAMNAFKELATRVADSRGAATILVEQSQSDVRSRKVNTSEGESQTKAGNTLSVQKTVSSTVPRGIERYTIKAGELTKRP